MVIPTPILEALFWRCFMINGVFFLKSDYNIWYHTPLSLLKKWIEIYLESCNSICLLLVLMGIKKESKNIHQNLLLLWLGEIEVGSMTVMSLNIFLVSPCSAGQFSCRIKIGLFKRSKVAHAESIPHHSELSERGGLNSQDDLKLSQLSRWFETVLNYKYDNFFIT